MQPQQITPAKSRKMLFIVLAGVIALVIVAAFLAYTRMSPDTKAMSASKNFMDAASAADVNKLIELDDATDEGSKKFLQGVAESLKGSYKQTDKTSKDGKWYVKYELLGAKSKYARTIVEKKDGRYVVSSIVFSTNELALIPSSSADDTPSTTTSNPSNPTTAQSTPAATTLACLTQDDYRYFFYDKKLPTVNYVTRESSGFFNVASASMFFKADSTKEDSFTTIYDDWAEFATKNPTKQWSFTLKGATYDAGADSTAIPVSVKLAKDRAEKVKTELIKRGVPESRIKVGNAFNNATEYQKGFGGEIFRKVEIAIINPCVDTSSSSATTTPASSAGR